MFVDVWFLPSAVAHGDLSRTTVVVIDILRATTTITEALHNGASAVIPCREIEAAEQLREQGTVELLGGERGGIAVEGFDYGNSPLDWTRDRVEGRVIGFTTTNGTKAVDSVRGAAEILLGSFNNVSAIVRRLAQKSEPILLLCAGTDGAVTSEDVLCAGAVIRGLLSAPPSVAPDCSDAARIAVEFWDRAAGATLAAETPATDPGAPNATPHPQILTELRASRGGRNLLALGYEKDIQRAAVADRWDKIPRLDQNGQFRLI